MKTGMKATFPQGNKGVDNFSNKAVKTLFKKKDKTKGTIFLHNPYN